VLGAVGTVGPDPLALASALDAAGGGG